MIGYRSRRANRALRSLRTYQFPRRNIGRIATNPVTATDPCFSHGTKMNCRAAPSVWRAVAEDGERINRGVRRHVLTPLATLPEHGATISSGKPPASPDYILQGFVTKSLFSVMEDPFQ